MTWCEVMVSLSCVVTLMTLPVLLFEPSGSTTFAEFYSEARPIGNKSFSEWLPPLRELSAGEDNLFLQDPDRKVMMAVPGFLLLCLKRAD